MRWLRALWQWNVRVPLCWWGLVSCQGDGNVDATWFRPRWGGSWTVDRLWWDDSLASPLFDTGGVLEPGWNRVTNETGRPEPLWLLEHTDGGKS